MECSRERSTEMNVKWYDEQDKQNTLGAQEGHIPKTKANVGDRMHSGFLDLNFRNSINEKNGQRCMENLDLDATLRFYAPREPLTVESRTSATEKHITIKTECSIKIASDKTHDGSDVDILSAAAVPTRKPVSRSKFYVECSDEDSSTPSGEHFAHLSEEHKQYIQRTSHESFHKECNIASKQQNNHHLFDSLLLIGLSIGSDKTKVPYTLIKYPSDANVPPHTDRLCFPDAQKWTPSSCEQSYSLVLTSETGQRKFGYCRRVLPEGSPTCLPLVYCILSSFRARGFYYNILKELESRHGQPEHALLAFISSLYNSRFPDPGQTLQIVPISTSVEESLDTTLHILRRPYDLRLEEQDLVEIFDILEIPTLLQVFGSILLERKVVFISNSFSKLSSCTEAIQSILYPFSWQHVLISVLPPSLLDFCQSPTPYVVGILDDDDSRVLEPLHSFQEGIVVNLDESKVLRKVGDESSILPRVSVSHLRTSLELVFDTGGTAESSIRNVLISEAFLRMFADLCGHYRHHILSINGEVVFDRESFIKSASSGSIRLFLKWFAETNMFSAFIDSRLQNEHGEDRFDQRAFERAEERRKQNGGKKKTKNFKERFKSWTGNR